MPNIGDGDLVGTQGQVLPIGTIYLATYNSTTPVPAPTAALGTGEPATAFVKVGCLQDDMFNITESDPGVVEYRRGFRQRYYGEVINKTGDKAISAVIVEPQPAIVSALTGDATTALTGGTSLVLRAGQYYDKTMLVVYYDAQNLREYHLYNPHVRARYKMVKGGAGGGGANADFLNIELTMKLITFKNNAGLFTDLTWDEF